ncbi:zinc finger and SCAN domain-containing protein 16-like isoform X1 [Pantherophis guttatus]|uniref:Zinc finger and SCAN domain-containing protein 16-like isoform X1 n=1 Tax=Pantherophis guttatus TaxID=94885 RepID=A0A6P9C3X0_PANGU|nr:zinc finger and SCAN domain-containing protein 16-like isoform X1 [Pantherophis guttatus]XP_034278943.1 zinc finger and SCAN domain-containing protein 16-like isoform X1 [Pantherophis guttatus]XP_034278944.1 zinc finger and SCAN domain-containing protein 16-like isoform X1 [Pantherophis guttatus]
MRRKIAAKRNMVAQYFQCQTQFEQRVQPLVKMEKEPDPAGSDPLGMSEGSVKTYRIVPVGTGGGSLRLITPQQTRNERLEAPQRWEIQGQELPTPELTPVQSPAWRNLQVPELTLTEDIETYLTTFEDVAEACKWPREQWVTRLVPALNGAALQAYNSLDPRESGDYGKVKAAILREDAVSLERQRQHFRHLRYQEAEGPRDVCSRLRGLCYRWLEPESRTKEQIVELLILEQFLTILPEEMQEWVQEYHPKTCIQAVTLAEHFLLKQQDNERWDQQVLGPYMLEESVNLPESEQVVSDIQQVLCRENKEELNEHASSVAGDEIQTKNEEEYLLQESSKRQRNRLLPNLQVAPFAHQTPNSQLALKKQPLHKQEALFPCPECGKNFSRKSTLTRHRRVHTGVKPHQCTECGKRFLHKFNLVNHMRTHVREESNRCSLCGKNAKRNSGQGSLERKAGCCECTGSSELQYSVEQTTQDAGESFN